MVIHILSSLDYHAPKRARNYGDIVNLMTVGLDPKIYKIQMANMWSSALKQTICRLICKDTGSSPGMILSRLVVTLSYIRQWFDHK